MTTKFDFTGRTVIVTGGNRGIGYAISEALCKAGSTVAIIYRSSKDAPEVAAQLAKKYNVRCEAWQCDVGDQELTKKTFLEIHEKLGNVTGLFANAGVSVLKPALELDQKDLDYVYGANVAGQFYCAQAAANMWKKAGYQKGSIVLNSSMSSEIVNRGLTQAFYNSSKAAASNLIKQLAVEWADLGIRVNALCPGYVKTDQTQKMEKKFLKFQEDLVPLKRFSEPEEQAPMVLLLLSDESSYMTATNYYVDGGAQAW